MALMGDLITVARTFYDRGFEIVASREKIPVHPWKNDPNDGSLIPREKLYAMAMRQVESGRADSISLRLNADLAAIDLDFYSPDLADEFVDLFDRKIGLPYTAAGKKGCKIFIRLENKDGIEKTFRIGNTFYPDDGSGIKNDLEIKCDLSAVFGRHSDGIEYHAYPGCPGIWQLQSIDDLPVMPVWQIEKLLNDATENIYFTKNQSGLDCIKPDQYIARAYFCAAMALRTDPYIPDADLKHDLKRAMTIVNFLDEYKYEFPSDFVKYLCGFGDSSKWPRLIARMAADFEYNNDFYNDFRSNGNRIKWRCINLFGHNHDLIVAILGYYGYSVSEIELNNVFKAYEKLESIMNNQ